MARAITRVDGWNIRNAGSLREIELSLTYRRKADDDQAERYDVVDGFMRHPVRFLLEERFKYATGEWMTRDEVLETNGSRPRKLECECAVDGLSSSDHFESPERILWLRVLRSDDQSIEPNSMLTGLFSSDRRQGWLRQVGEPNIFLQKLFQKVIKHPESPRSWEEFMGLVVANSCAKIIAKTRVELRIERGAELEPKLFFDVTADYTAILPDARSIHWTSNEPVERVRQEFLKDAERTVLQKAWRYIDDIKGELPQLVEMYLTATGEIAPLEQYMQ